MWGQPTFTQIMEALQSQKVDKLDLTKNASLSLKPMEHLPSLCDALKANTTVKILILRELELADPAAESLSEMLKENNYIEEIDLGKNKITTAGVVALSKGLKVNQSVVTLQLRDQQSKLSEEVLEAFKDAFQQNITLVRLQWDVNSTKTNVISKFMTRNMDISRCVRNDREYVQLLPDHMRENPPDLTKPAHQRGPLPTKRSSGDEAFQAAYEREIAPSSPKSLTEGEHVDVKDETSAKVNAAVRHLGSSKNDSKENMDDERSADGEKSPSHSDIRCLEPDALMAEESHTVRKSPFHADGMYWEIYIDRRDGRSFGIDVEELAEGGLVVKSIEKQGAIHEWNVKNELESIQEGDRIVSINGSSKGLVEEMQKKQALTLEVRREFPRSRDRSDSVEVAPSEVGDDGLRTEDTVSKAQASKMAK